MNAAIALFNEEGLSVSTANIAKRAGVSNGTLFNYFENKQALLDAIYLQTKSDLDAVIPHSGDADFNRQNMRENWQAYIAWVKSHQNAKTAMCLLRDSGLVSEEARQAGNEKAQPHVEWLERARSAGHLQAPNIQYAAELIYFHCDLVINQNLQGQDEELAFDMLCQSLGVSK